MLTAVGSQVTQGLSQGPSVVPMEGDGSSSSLVLVTVPSCAGFFPGLFQVLGYLRTTAPGCFFFLIYSMSAWDLEEKAGGETGKWYESDHWFPEERMKMDAVLVSWIEDYLTG